MNFHYSFLKYLSASIVNLPENQKQTEDLLSYIKKIINIYSINNKLMLASEPNQPSYYIMYLDNKELENKLKKFLLKKNLFGTNGENDFTKHFYYNPQNDQIEINKDNDFLKNEDFSNKENELMIKLECKKSGVSIRASMIFIYPTEKEHNILKNIETNKDERIKITQKYTDAFDAFINYVENDNKANSQGIKQWFSGSKWFSKESNEELQIGLNNINFDPKTNNLLVEVESIIWPVSKFSEKTAYIQQFLQKFKSFMEDDNKINQGLADKTQEYKEMLTNIYLYLGEKDSNMQICVPLSADAQKLKDKKLKEKYRVYLTEFINYINSNYFVADKKIEKQQNESIKDAPNKDMNNQQYHQCNQQYYEPEYTTIYKKKHQQLHEKDNQQLQQKNDQQLKLNNNQPNKKILLLMFSVLALACIVEIIRRY